MAKSRAKKAAATKKQRQVKGKRSAAGEKAGITKALTDAKRSAVAKWAWVTRQLNAKRA